MAVKVIVERCPQNHICPAVAICPVDALSQVGHAAPTVDPELCTECGECVLVCRPRTLVLEDELCPR